MSAGRPLNDESQKFYDEVAESNAAISSSRGEAYGDQDDIPTERVRPVGRYVLVVEDDADIRTTVADVLAQAGYDVLEAAHGVEALRILDVEYMTSQYAAGVPRRPSVILLDILMPVMSGPKFFAELRRSRPAFDDVPVVIMSADANITAFQAWAVSTVGLDAPGAVLAKPFAAAELLRKVRAAAGPP